MNFLFKLVLRNKKKTGCLGYQFINVIAIVPYGTFDLKAKASKTWCKDMYRYAYESTIYAETEDGLVGISSSDFEYDVFEYQFYKLVKK